MNHTCLQRQKRTPHVMRLTRRVCLFGDEDEGNNEEDRQRRMAKLATSTEVGSTGGGEVEEVGKAWTTDNGYNGCLYSFCMAVYLTAPRRGYLYSTIKTLSCHRRHARTQACPIYSPARRLRPILQYWGVSYRSCADCGPTSGKSSNRDGCSEQFLRNIIIPAQCPSVMHHASFFDCVVFVACERRTCLTGKTSDKIESLTEVPHRYRATHPLFISLGES